MLSRPAPGQASATEHLAGLNQGIALGEEITAGLQDVSPVHLDQPAQAMAVKPCPFAVEDDVPGFEFKQRDGLDDQGLTRPYRRQHAAAGDL